MVEATTTGPSLTGGLGRDIEVGDRLVMMTRDRVKAPEGWENIGVGAWERIVGVDEPLEVTLVLKDKPKAVVKPEGYVQRVCHECGHRVGVTTKKRLRVHTYGQLEERCSGSGSKAYA